MHSSFARSLPALIWLSFIATSIATSLATPLVPRAVTVYHQRPVDGSPTATSAIGNYTGAAAYDPTVLNPPPVPNPPPATQWTIVLAGSADQVPGLSIKQSGTFFGFSIEFSVVNQVLGKSSNLLQVPFLNLMSNIAQRAGAVHVRVGGNTQETATLVDSISDGKIIEKDYSSVTGTTNTPPLIYTRDVIDMMANISSLVSTKWYLGVPFNDTNNLRLEIIQLSESVLGNNLLGFQVGNEPDLYGPHGRRNITYSPFDYFGEFGTVVDALNADKTAYPVRNNLIGPSVAGGSGSGWAPEMVWDTGFITTYADSLGAMAVEHYPSDNCYTRFGIGAYVDPQAAFQDYLNHTSAQALCAPYLNSTAIAQAAGKPFVMFETNTASCGGFPGISDSFGSALWALDYGLQMAHSNFSGAMLHVGGQDVYYNPFTPPPTNESSYHLWTIGPIYFAPLIIAEVFGTSGNAQIIDMAANNGSMFTPAYAIYENGVPTRIALMNFISDSSGASDYTATISINGFTLPSQVKVKYLLAESVSSKDNVTWAGQTFGSIFESDGRLHGDLSIQSVACDTTANTCAIRVPAPGFALVFLTEDALSPVDSAPIMTATFATTVTTKMIETATVDPSVLATSNGHSGKDRRKGSTSRKSAKGMNLAVASRGSKCASVWAGLVSAMVSVIFAGVTLLYLHDFGMR